MKNEHVIFRAFLNELWEEIQMIRVFEFAREKGFDEGYVTPFKSKKKVQLISVAPNSTRKQHLWQEKTNLDDNNSKQHSENNRK